jgi:23S rRNA G2069 N7-methylase RlmK/C1962 C5-methylase RlmI
MADPSRPGESARLHAATVAEHKRLAGLQAIGAAEELVAAARIVDLLERQVEARRRYAAAEHQLVKAQRAGSPDTIVAGRLCAAAEAESERVCNEGLEEMGQIVEAGADRFDLVIDQYGRWADAADAEFYARLRAGQ